MHSPARGKKTCDLLSCLRICITKNCRTYCMFVFVLVLGVFFLGGGIYVLKLVKVKSLKLKVPVPKSFENEFSLN